MFPPKPIANDPSEGRDSLFAQGYQHARQFWTTTMDEFYNQAKFAYYELERELNKRTRQSAEYIKELFTLELELEEVKADAEKDYKGMREFQAKFIRADKEREEARMKANEIGMELTLTRAELAQAKKSEPKISVSDIITAIKNAPTMICGDCSGKGTTWVYYTSNDHCNLCLGTGKIPGKELNELKKLLKGLVK